MTANSSLTTGSPGLVRTAILKPRLLASRTKALAGTGQFQWDGTGWDVVLGVMGATVDMCQPVKHRGKSGGFVLVSDDVHDGIGGLSVFLSFCVRPNDADVLYLV